VKQIGAVERAQERRVAPAAGRPSAASARAIVLGRSPAGARIRPAGSARSRSGSDRRSAAVSAARFATGHVLPAARYFRPRPTAAWPAAASARRAAPTRRALQPTAPRIALRAVGVERQRHLERQLGAAARSSPISMMRAPPSAATDVNVEIERVRDQRRRGRRRAQPDGRERARPVDGLAGRSPGIASRRRSAARREQDQLARLGAGQLADDQVIGTQRRGDAQQAVRVGGGARSIQPLRARAARRSRPTRRSAGTSRPNAASTDGSAATSPVTMHVPARRDHRVEQRLHVLCCAPGTRSTSTRSGSTSARIDATTPLGAAGGNAAETAVPSGRRTSTTGLSGGGGGYAFVRVAPQHVRDRVRIAQAAVVERQTRAAIDQRRVGRGDQDLRDRRDRRAATRGRGAPPAPLVSGASVATGPVAPPNAGAGALPRPPPAAGC
jgi:hypothetical protein